MNSDPAGPPAALPALPSPHCRRRRRWWAEPVDDRTYAVLLAMLVLAALLLRIVLALPALAAPETLLRPDSSGYWEPALYYAGIAPRGDLATMTIRPLGIVLYYAGIIRIFGNSFLAAGLTGCVIGALTVLPVAWSGSAWHGRRVGLAAGALFLLHPTAIAQSPLILADTLLAFVLAFQMLWMIRTAKNRKFGDYALLTATAILACYVKPVNLPMVLLGLPLLALLFLPEWRRVLTALGIAVAGFLLLLLPYWLWRSGETGSFDPNAPNLYFHNGSALLAAAGPDHDSEAIRLRLLQEAETVFSTRPELYATIRERNQWKIARYRELLRQYPWTALRLQFWQPAQLLPDLPGVLENARITTSGRGTMAVLRRDGLWKAAMFYLDGRWEWLLIPLPLMLTAMVILTGFLQVFGWLRHRQWRQLLIFGCMVVYYLTAPGPVISARYQLPAVLLLCVMTAAFWCAPGPVKETEEPSCSSR